MLSLPPLEPVAAILGSWDLENEANVLLTLTHLMLLGRRQANLCFHFAGSGENLPDIAKSRDATLDNKLFSP